MENGFISIFGKNIQSYGIITNKPKIILMVTLRSCTEFDVDLKQKKKDSIHCRKKNACIP